MHLTGYVQTPIGKWPVVLDDTTKKLSASWGDWANVLALVAKYGAQVAPVVIAERKAGKSWGDIALDLLLAYAEGKFKAAA